MNSLTTPYRVVVMGKIGSGKSSVLNSLTATNTFKVGSSETKEIQFFTGRFKRRFTPPEITFVDTPGFFDCSSSDYKTAARIALALNKLSEGQNLVLFCFPAYELHKDSAVQASCKFLKLIMNKIAYDQIAVVLTHGNRLTPEEFEKAVVKMTTDFISRLKNTLNFRVKEEVFVYRKGQKQDGLDGIFNCLRFNREAKEKCSDSSEFSFQETFNKVQDFLLELQGENEILRNEIDEIKREMVKRSRGGSRDLQTTVQDFMKEEKNSLDSFKEEVRKEISAFKLELASKDKEIAELKEKLNEKEKPSKDQSHVSNAENVKPKKDTKEKKEMEANPKENVKPSITLLRHSKQKYESPQTYKGYSHNHSLSIGEYHTSAALEPYSKARLTSLLKSIDTISKSRTLNSTAATSMNYGACRNPVGIDLSKASRQVKEQTNYAPTLLKPANASRLREYCYTDRSEKNYQC
eukprot:TRINITY_DN3064_c0_g7_i1.p1 TRINITY_DN3064_c0_g7~~TRINITY_DN3064_c0_g7_i1.p1  ORF type:complete len:464 (-),score=117.06 TRINITY_DN3064_c0_g7_i1:106-1497(-)